ncbi:unnamed protein product [Discula destructiva]
MNVGDAPADEGDHAPRQSYNFAPGYHGIVYRADVPDYGAGPRRAAKSKTAKGSSTITTTPEDADAAEEEDNTTEATTGEPKKTAAASPAEETHYKLQSMKWGLIPFWTKRNPDYGAMMKTINCRADSLAQAGGMWASMKGRKRCVVLAQGFYEWLKPPGARDKVPHFVKRKDGQLMCFAGLWDCVQYEDGGAADKHYTYTIITTESNAQMAFLHDRMPVILEAASEEMQTWLDPGRWEWTAELQGVLRPFEGELEVYPVSKEVGKVGNNSPSFIIPIASRENKSNIANFFANAQAKNKKADAEKEVEIEVDEKPGSLPAKEAKTVDEVVEEADDGGMGVSSPTAGSKRKGDADLQDEEPPLKKEAVSSSPVKAKPLPSPSKPAARDAKTKSATSNGTKSPGKPKGTGAQKITKFFGNST